MSTQTHDLPIVELPQAAEPQELTLDQAATVAGGPVAENPPG